MAKLRTSGKKKITGVMKIKIVVEKLQKSLSSLGRKYSNVPEDVKEGHFAVIAMNQYKEPRKRFVVPSSFLRHPSFLSLLEQAAEEFGFDHGGALTIPCHPSELESILAEQR